MISLLKYHFAKQRAAADVTRLFSDHLPEEPGKATESAEYQQEFRIMTDLLADLEVLADDPVILREPAKRSESITNVLQQPRKASNSRLPWVALAASLLVAVMVGVSQYEKAPEVSPALDTARYVTRIGEQKTVTLTDGSTITLNTGTQLLVEFFNDRRSIRLEKGEAYFDIARDPLRPLSVDVEARQVTVLGTQFNILKSGNKFSLSVVDGVVALHRANEEISSSLPVLSASPGETVRVTRPAAFRVQAGMVAEFDSDKRELSAYQQTDMSAVHSWRTGILQFKAVPLSEVIQTLNRYSGKKIVIEDTEIQNQKVFATVRLARLDKALALLEETMPVKVVHNKDRILILKRTWN